MKSKEQKRREEAERLAVYRALPTAEKLARATGKKQRARLEVQLAKELGS